LELWGGQKRNTFFQQLWAVYTKCIINLFFNKK